MSLQVTPVPAFNDNYLWLLHNATHAAVVDPGDAQAVEAALARLGLELAAILVTHHHGDHVGGLATLTGHWAVPVFGPAGEGIAGLTRELRGGDHVSVPELSLSLEVLDVPGHTRGHIAYAGDDRVFCGDTLFACGCGRLFEGTPAQMHASLSRLASLPGDTRVYCAHEYTLANIRFAQAVEPDNAALADRAARDAATRQAGQPTVPSRIALERATNPFLRCSEPAVQRSASARAGRPLTDPVEVFAVLREWKNNF